MQSPDIGPIAALPQVIAGAYPATPASASVFAQTLRRGCVGRRNAGNRLPPPAAGRENTGSNLVFTRRVKTGRSGNTLATRSLARFSLVNGSAQGQ
jgi:hypothetical protein